MPYGMPYGYETRKRHGPYAGFAPPYYVRQPFPANSFLQNFIHILIIRKSYS